MEVNIKANVANASFFFSLQELLYSLHYLKLIVRKFIMIKIYISSYNNGKLKFRSWNTKFFTISPLIALVANANLFCLIPIGTV